MLGSKIASERFTSLVRQLVKEEGSRAAVARRLGLNASYVSKLVRGEVHGVRESTLRDVANRLGIDVAFFDAPAVSITEWRGWRGEDPPPTLGAPSSGTSLGELVRHLDAKMRNNETPSPDAFREVARMFLGGIAVSLAKRIRDAESDETVARSGPALVDGLLTMLTPGRMQVWSVRRESDDTKGDPNG
jgi:transcriptional regulator with XRE-family HTH domain